MDFEKFLNKVQEMKDERKNICEKIKTHNLPVILYGAGIGAKFVTQALSEYDVHVDGYAVDDEFYKEGSTYLNRPVHRLSKILNHPKNYVIIPAINEPKKDTMNFFHNDEIIGYTPSILSDKFFDVDSSKTFIDKDFFLKEKEKFAQTFSFLEDDLSKETMLSWLETKITGDYSGNFKTYDAEEEYFNNISEIALISKGGGIGYIDCGAFTGDTVAKFVQWSKGNYDKIFAFEPDPSNFSKMEKFVKEKGFENVICLNYGTWKEDTQLHFSVKNNMGSFISDDETEIINVRKIDSVAGDNPISLIKMDIEGSELSALQGAYQTIKKNKPVLAICAYHKSEDLITLPQYIKSVNSDYKLYLRRHSFCLEFDLVLYAIQK